MSISVGETSSSVALAPTPATMLPFLMAGGLWFLELRARRAREAYEAGGGGQEGFVVCAGLADCRHLLRSCLFEALGFAACTILAVTLLLRGDASVPQDPADLEAWLRIKAEWPLLTTADTLIALQAMLRLPPLVSAALRSSSASPTRAAAAGGAPAALMLAGAVTRTTLLWCSEYHRLDGPLGGFIHMIFEAAAIPPLLRLSSGALPSAGARRSLSLLALAAASAAAVAWRHRLALADESPALDSMYSLAELLELFASVAYLTRSLALWGGPRGASSTLMHFLLPLQQGLSMYYLMLAFEDGEGLIGAGEPLFVLRASSTCQVMLYLAAAVMHAVLCVEAPESAAGTD